MTYPQHIQRLKQSGLYSSTEIDVIEAVARLAYIEGLEMAEYDEAARLATEHFYFSFCSASVMGDDWNTDRYVQWLSEDINRFNDFAFEMAKKNSIDCDIKISDIIVDCYIAHDFSGEWDGEECVVADVVHNTASMLEELEVYFDFAKKFAKKSEQEKEYFRNYGLQTEPHEDDILIIRDEDESDRYRELQS